MSATNLHASSVCFGPSRGVLILGPSGSGKSRLALDLIEAGAQLVSDDQVFLAVEGGALYARAPRSIAGLIEVRGLGLIRLAHRRLTRLVLAADLSPHPAPRMPGDRSVVLRGISLPCIAAHANPSFARALARYVTAQDRVG